MRFDVNDVKCMDALASLISHEVMSDSITYTRFPISKGFSTMLSEKEFDLVSRSIDRAIRARSLRTVRDLKSTFSYLQHHKSRFLRAS